jgi:hypothetical protein
MTALAADRADALSGAERWLLDERSLTHAPGGMTERTVDVTHAGAWLDERAARGVPWAFALLLVRGAAIAIGRRPQLGKTVAGYRSLEPGTVDIGLSASGMKPGASVVVTGADGMGLPAIETAVESAAREEGGQARAGGVGKWIEWIPFGFLRRLLLRWLLGTFSFRRRREGTFHVTFASGVDVMAPLRFLGGSVLGAGRVRDAFVAVEGRIEKRRVATLMLVVDHVAMDGVRAAALLNEIAEVLEGDTLAAEMGGFAQVRSSTPQ